MTGSPLGSPGLAMAARISVYGLVNRSHCHPTLSVLKFVPVLTATPEL
jgi:hypothetical protein